MTKLLKALPFIVCCYALMLCILALTLMPINNPSLSKFYLIYTCWLMLSSLIDLGFSLLARKYHFGHFISFLFNLVAVIFPIIIGLAIIRIIEGMINMLFISFSSLLLIYAFKIAHQILKMARNESF